MHMIGSDGPLSTLGCHVIFDRAAIVETCCSCDQTEESEVSSGVQVGGDVSTGALDSYKDTPWHSQHLSHPKSGDFTAAWQPRTCPTPGGSGLALRCNVHRLHMWVLMT